MLRFRDEVLSAFGSEGGLVIWLGGFHTSRMQAALKAPIWYSCKLQYRYTFRTDFWVSTKASL